MELLNNLPPEFLIFLQETVFPRIESVIGSMMNMNMF